MIIRKALGVFGDCKIHGKILPTSMYSTRDYPIPRAIVGVRCAQKCSSQPASIAAITQQTLGPGQTDTYEEINDLICEQFALCN